MRVQRAWEVLRSTGRGLNSWHSDTPKPTLDLNMCKAILVEGEVSLINRRINKRFDQMMGKGLIQEAESSLKKNQDQNVPLKNLLVIALSV